MALSELYINDFIESKDDCYPVTLDYHLRSQLRLLHGLEFDNLPYVRLMDIYSAVSNMYTAIVYVEILSGQMHGGVGWAKMEKRVVSRPLPRNEVADAVWKVVRRQNYLVRKQCMSDINPMLETLFNFSDDFAGLGDFGGSVGSQRLQDKIITLIGDEPENILDAIYPLETGGNVEAGGNDISTTWRGRTSHARCSGIHARWPERISQTNVGGFGGGGMKRPDRSDPFTSAILRKRIRFHPPIGLVAAATRAKQPLHQTPENLDLVWSVESLEWDTTSGSNLTSDDESEWRTSEDEVRIGDDVREANPNEGEGELQIASWEEEGDAESDPWPEPDHRYTHLGPGRGKATRHLSAVNQLGFAGGGVSRPFASAILPELTAAGGGTMGRVKAVPEGLVAAAGASLNIKPGKNVSIANVEKSLETTEHMEEAAGRAGWKPLEAAVFSSTSLSSVKRSKLARISRSEFIMSVAVIVFAALYLWEVRGRLSA